MIHTHKIKPMYCVIKDRCFLLVYKYVCVNCHLHCKWVIIKAICNISLAMNQGYCSFEQKMLNYNLELYNMTSCVITLVFSGETWNISKELMHCQEQYSVGSVAGAA